jgi:hypothetical protein
MISNNWLFFEDIILLFFYKIVIYFSDYFLLEIGGKNAKMEHGENYTQRRFFSINASLSRREK